MIVDVGQARTEDVRISLNLLYNIEHSARHVIVSLYIVHSHVVYVFGSWRDDLYNTIEERITDKSENAREIAVVVAEDEWIVGLDQIAQVSVDMGSFFVVLCHWKILEPLEDMA